MSEPSHQQPEAVREPVSPRPRTDVAPVPAAPGPSTFRGLAKHPSLARQQLAQVGRRAGNGAVLALLGNSAGAGPALQRQQQPTPAPAPGVAPPGPGPAPAAPLPDFGNTTFIAGGSRFDLEYKPVGPLPQIGKVTVKLKVHVDFKDFDRTMMRRKEFAGHRWTREQLRNFKWPDDQKAAWTGKFAAAVKAGWAEKHAFVLDQPDFAKYRATCNIDVVGVDDPEQANNKITAQWVPPGAPRIRSSVSGNTSELDVRDVDQPETHNVEPATLIRQIPGFEHNKSDITPEVETGIVAFEDQFRRQRQPGGPLAAIKPEDLNVFVAGRATKAGSRRHNKDLGAARADKVLTRLMDDLDLQQGRSKAVGAENATDDPEFRRVDVSATVAARDVTQNVAAHEAGHMFGLGDEYVEEAPKDPDVLAKFPGQKPSHYDEVRDTMGDDAANELLDQDGPSMMSSGSEVKAGHYVFFLKSLNSVTSKSWKVE